MTSKSFAFSVIAYVWQRPETEAMCALTKDFYDNTPLSC